MSIPIIRDDVVDWEPLVMRFVPSRELQPNEAKAIAEFINTWFDAAADAEPQIWKSAKEWGCGVTDQNEVGAACEFMPWDELKRLAHELGDRFPVIHEIRIGHPLDGPATTATFDWFIFTAPGAPSSDGNQIEISFTQVTLGQFEEFLAASGYVPVADRLERQRGYLVNHFKINFGPSPKHPLLGVPYDDAVAFCNWIGLRLPTDLELRWFFHSACRENRSIDQGGQCWTSTPAGKDEFVTWNGPYLANQIEASDEPYRMALHRHEHDLYHGPCFRVVRDVTR